MLYVVIGGKQGKPCSRDRVPCKENKIIMVRMWVQGNPEPIFFTLTKMVTYGKILSYGYGNWKNLSHAPIHFWLNKASFKWIRPSYFDPSHIFYQYFPNFPTFGLFYNLYVQIFETHSHFYSLENPQYNWWRLWN